MTKDKEILKLTVENIKKAVKELEKNNLFTGNSTFIFKNKWTTTNKKQNQVKKL